MRTKFALFSALLVLAAGMPELGRAEADRGGDISGGGAWVAPDGNRVLLDLYVSRPEIARESGSPGMKLPVSPALESIFIERLNKKEFELVKKAQARLDLWDASSPVVVGLVREALERAPLFYTSYRIGFRDEHYFIPEELESGERVGSIQTMAYYSKGFGILVSKSDFESLSERDQIALLIHESLRHVQISYGYDLSDRALQNITAAIVLRNPEENESLDGERYLDGELLRVVQAPAKRREELNTAWNSVCAIQKAYEDKIVELNSSSQEPVDLSVCDATHVGAEVQARALSNHALGVAKLLGDYLDSNNRSLSRAEYEIVYLDSSDLLVLCFMLNTISVDDSIARIGPSWRELEDVALNASLAVGIDAAIAEANGTFGWLLSRLSGSRSAILSSLETLVAEGFLKE